MILWLELAGGAVALVLVAANALTTRRLWSSASFERPQKIAQTALIWLLPGSVLAVRHFLTESHGERRGDPTVGQGAYSLPDYESPPAHHHGGGGHDGT